MNSYGLTAQRAWSELAPDQVPNLPANFFAELGEQIQDQVIEVADQMVARMELSRDYLTNVGQRQMARLRAEEMVLQDLVWDQLPTSGEYEAEEEDEEEGEQSEYQYDDEGRRLEGMPTDRNHPVWEAYNDDEISVEEYGRRLRAYRQEVEEAKRQAVNESDSPTSG